MSRFSSRWIITFLTLKDVYVAAGKLGLRFAFDNPSATPVWPPTGIAIAALLLLGLRFWPGVLLGAFLVNVTTAGNAATAAAIAVGNTLEAVLGAALSERFARGRRAFERPRHVFAFAAIAGTVAAPVAATVGVTSLALAGFAAWPSYGAVWLTWWLGLAGLTRNAGSSSGPSPRLVGTVDGWRSRAAAHGPRGTGPSFRWMVTTSKEATRVLPDHAVLSGPPSASSRGGGTARWPSQR